MQKYLKLLEDIKAKGTYKPAAREGMPGTQSLFGYQFRHDLSEGFPLLTTKKINFKHIVTELLWFLKGDTNIKYLVDNGCNIWNEDQKMFSNRNIFTEEGSLGYQYGHLWRNWGGQDRRWQPKSSFKAPNDNPVYNITVKNIGCIGKNNKILEPKIRRKLYVTWTNMLSRCYIKSHNSYPNYGGKGVYVCNRWLCFEYFVGDCINLLNWNNKEKDWKNYQLDKDLKGDGFVYKKDFCIWDNRSSNASNTSDRKVNYTFKNLKTGEEISGNNLLKIGKNIGVEDLHKVSSQFTKNKIKQYKGWKLIRKETINKQGIDQIKNLIDGLTNNPMSRRHIVTAWNPSTLDDMALNACHCLVQFNCRPLSSEQRVRWCLHNGLAEKSGEDISTGEYLQQNYFIEPSDLEKAPKYYLDCQMYQRSADSFLGVPYNIASYALLTEILAKMCNMIPGEYIHTFGDVHIYDNHREAVDIQLGRSPGQLPTLEFSETSRMIIHSDTSLDEKISKLSHQDFTMKDYNPQARIKAKLSTGLK